VGLGEVAGGWLGVVEGRGWGRHLQRALRDGMYFQPHVKHYTRRGGAGGAAGRTVGWGVGEVGREGDRVSGRLVGSVLGLRLAFPPLRSSAASRASVWATFACFSPA
jgi:hypothetical protein